MVARLALLIVFASIQQGSASLWTWLPDFNSFVHDLAPKQDKLELDFQRKTEKFQGMTLHWRNHATWLAEIVDPGAVVFACQRLWMIPLTAVLLYAISIPVLQKHIQRSGKWNMRTFAFYWNAGLSVFSWCGVFACVPILISELTANGFYFTTCAPANWFANSGWTSLFMFLFAFSKFPELVDTIILVLAGKPVIALQWWHHSTVLLYCWHCVCSKIATSVWFAAMNYSVHSIMYAYFALMGTKYRKAVSRYAIFITLAQLAQMLVGMIVTIAAVIYQDSGAECHVNRTNSVLGLAMYFSYFVLFLELYIQNYVTKSRKRKDDDGKPLEDNSGSMIAGIRGLAARELGRLSVSCLGWRRVDRIHTRLFGQKPKLPL